MGHKISWEKVCPKSEGVDKKIKSENKMPTALEPPVLDKTYF